MTWEDDPPPGRFDDDEPAPCDVGVDAPIAPRIGASLSSSILRAVRRANGEEKPIALPWPVLAEHFGGGLWPGLHFLNSGTGVGKTQWALQVAIHAAKARVPVLYIGLELGELDLALRVLGEEAGVPWSHLWTGKAGPKYLDRVRAAEPALRNLPLHYEVARPMGLSALAIGAAIKALRELYPETNGPGSRPLLVVVDFLQLVGDEPGNERELRVRIGAAAYVLRDAANRLGVAILCIASVARERYKMLTDIVTAAGLAWAEDENGCPIDRRILDPDAIVGTAKESGEIEYSADSVSVLARVPATWDGAACDVVFATAKGRATGAMWTPLRFTGFHFEECSDRGGRMVVVWRDAAEKRAAAKEAKATAKEDAKVAKINCDAAAVASYVLAHQGCKVTEARVNAARNNPRRWAPAIARLGPALRETREGKTIRLTLDREALPADMAALVTVDGDRGRGHSPPNTPPPSTSTVDGRGPTVDRGQHGPSTSSTLSTEGASP